MKRVVVLIVLALVAVHSKAEQPLGSVNVPIIQVQRYWVKSVNDRASLIQVSTQLYRNPYYGFEQQPMLLYYAAARIQFFMTPDFRFYKLGKRTDFWGRYARRKFEDWEQ